MIIDTHYIPFQIPLTMYLSVNNTYCKERTNKLLFRLICTDQRISKVTSIFNSLLSLPLCGLPTQPSLEQKVQGNCSLDQILLDKKTNKFLGTNSLPIPSFWHCYLPDNIYPNIQPFYRVYIPSTSGYNNNNNQKIISSIKRIENELGVITIWGTNENTTF